MEVQDFEDIFKALHAKSLRDKEKIRSLLIRKGCSEHVSIGLRYLREKMDWQVAIILLAPLDEETISQIREICPRVSIECNYGDYPIAYRNFEV